MHKEVNGVEFLGKKVMGIVERWGNKEEKQANKQAKIGVNAGSGGKEKECSPS